jgi:RNA 2',3'-cyclic 3'-phosphodiesterase
VVSAAGGRALTKLDLHVTLCFLGAVDDGRLAALCERAGQIQASSFELLFDGLELWREARILAAIAACVPPAGRALAEALASAARELGLAPDVRAWRPHLTLVRGATARRLPDELAGTASPALQLPLPVSRFYLAQSQELGRQADGAVEPRRYRTLASWPLRP